MSPHESPSLAFPAPEAWIEPPRGSVRATLRRGLALPGVLWRGRELVAASVARELAARFRGSLLGPLWPLVHPLALFAIYGFVFAQLFGMRLAAAGGEPGVGYGVWLFVGSLVWASFSEGVGRGTTSIVEHRGLVRQLAFPGATLPLTRVLGATATFLLGAAAFLAVRTLLGAPGPSLAQLAWVPPLLALQVALTYGLALAAATLHVVLRDTAHAVSLALSVAMFATPVFWVPDPAVLPPVEPWLDWIHANPLFWLLEGWRSVLLGTASSAQLPASPGPACVALLPWSAAAFALGAALFCALEPRLPDEV